jgi:hypothetical protein
MTTTSSKHILSVGLAATAPPQATVGNASTSARRSALRPESQSYGDSERVFLIGLMMYNWKGQVR